MPDTLRQFKASIFQALAHPTRIAIVEALPVSEAVRRLIIKRASAVVIKNQAINEGMKSLRMVGIEKALEGVTTLEEILRVTAEDQ